MKTSIWAPLRLDANAILDPSGDQAGARSIEAPGSLRSLHDSGLRAAASL